MTQTTQAPKQEKKPETTQAPKKQKNPVDEGAYSKYVSLKFLSLSEAKLKDETIKELKELEENIKLCSGKIPVRTVNAAIGNEIIKLVEGVPVPVSIEAIIKNANAEKYYFG